MASTDNIKADSCFFHSVHAVLTLIDQDSLRMTYFCRWLLEAGQSLSEPACASVPPAVMDHPAAQASPFYECQSSGSVVPKCFGSWPPFMVTLWAGASYKITAVPPSSLIVFYYQRSRSISYCWEEKKKSVQRAERFRALNLNQRDTSLSKLNQATHDPTLVWDMKECFDFRVLLFFF